MARYINAGTNDGVLFTTATVSTDSTYSHTGTAVKSQNATKRFSLLGFSNCTEIWVRFDVYYVANNGLITMTWTPSSQTTSCSFNYRYITVGGSTRDLGGAWGMTANAINKLVFHLSTSTFQIYLNDTLIGDFSGLSLGNYLYNFQLSPSNSYISNLIIADYDISDESVVRITGDTSREISKGLAVLHGDTARALMAEVPLHADTSRALSASAELHADTLRVLPAAIPTIHGDTARTTSATVHLSADTKREVAVGVHLHGDTERSVVNSVTIHADTERALPFPVSIIGGTGGINNVTMTLAEKTLSDTFRLMSATPYNLQDVIKGAFFDFGYKFRVESTSQRDLMQTVTGTYDVDELLYNPIKYHVPPAEKHAYYPKRTNAHDGRQVLYGITAGQVAELCCEGINKTAVCAFDDFFPSSAQDDVITNYQSVLSGVFGWTSQVPRRQINVFIRGDAVYFLQRGYETGVIDLDAYTHSRPTIDRSLVRTMWARRADFYDRMTGSSGVWGDWYIESISDPDINHGGRGTTPPDVTLDSDGLVERTVERVETDDGERVITTDYEYTSTGRSKFLTREIQTTTENGETVEQRTIDHYPLENGQRYSVGRDADGNTSSGLGTYPFSDSMNKYSGEVWQLTRGGRWVTNNGDTIADSNSFPVNDRNTIEAIYTELKWMNRKTMERVTVDIIGTEINGVSSVGRVFDFFYRYELGGNEYFLVSNTVSYTARQFVQALNLVRWY